MTASDPLEAKLHALEQILVKQFRTLQKLVEITRGERSSLLTGEAERIMGCAEEKEAVLDQLSLIEDSRRMLLQDLEIHFQVHSEMLSINDLLPLINPAQAIPLKRLSEGISLLVIQVRDLSYGNQALATIKIDWLRSLQSFLVSAALPEPGYHPPSKISPPEEATAFGLDFRA